MARASRWLYYSIVFSDTECNIYVGGGACMVEWTVRVRCCLDCGVPVNCSEWDATICECIGSSSKLAPNTFAHTHSGLCSDF